MAPLVPVIARIVLGAVGAVALVHWLVRETRRINQELERVRAAPSADPAMREAMPTLRRDPKTGEWRPARGA